METNALSCLRDGENTNKKGGRSGVSVCVRDIKDIEP